MKKFMNIKSLVFIVMVTLFSACEQDYLDVNDDPNNPSDAVIDLVLPAGVSSVSFTLGGQYQVLGSLWAQHWTQSVGANQYAGIDNYDMSNSDFNRQWTELYAGALNDLKFVADKSAETGDWNYFLMAEVMSVYTFQLLSDLYDQIPYSEALQGVENTTPKFDNGQDIYNDLIVRIDAALAKDFSTFTVRSVGKEDLVFQGDMEKWVRFANTLKLKIFMRQSEARPDVAKAGIEALYNSGAQFLEVDAEMTDFIDVRTFRNPVFAVQFSADGNGRGGVDIAASNTVISFLFNSADPRLDAIYNTPLDGGGHAGLDQGDFSNAAFGTARELSQPNVTATHPVVFMGAAESKFLQAEAIVRYGVAGDAKSMYESGIDASFLKLGVAGSAGFYDIGGTYEYNAGTAIQQIIEQKWLSMANFQGVEAYLEHNRTGFPDFFTVTPNNVTGGLFPRRLIFPQSESERNKANVPTLKQVFEKVWWDTK